MFKLRGLREEEEPVKETEKEIKLEPVTWKPDKLSQGRGNNRFFYCLGSLVGQKSRIDHFTVCCRVEIKERNLVAAAVMVVVVIQTTVSK